MKDPVFDPDVDQLVTVLLVSALAWFALFLSSCEPARGYGFQAYGENEQGDVLVANAAADCVVTQIEALGLMPPGVAAKALRSADVSIVMQEDPVYEGPGEYRSGSTDGHIVYAMRAALPHELVHVILCATQMGQCDTMHQARAWWLPITESCK